MVLFHQTLQGIHHAPNLYSQVQSQPQPDCLGNLKRYYSRVSTAKLVLPHLNLFTGVPSARHCGERFDTYELSVTVP